MTSGPLDLMGVSFSGFQAQARARRDVGVDLVDLRSLR
jgi:hypothetical protein